jgi:DNA-directed RNA polymerase specialized sigma24 family protein
VTRRRGSPRVGSRDRLRTLDQGTTAERGRIDAISQVARVGSNLGPSPKTVPGCFPNFGLSSSSCSLGPAGSSSPCHEESVRSQRRVWLSEWLTKMTGPWPDTPRWPERLKDLIPRLTSPEDQPDREKIRDEIWIIVATAVAGFVRAHSRKLGPMGQDDLDEIAAQKSLELMRRVEDGGWEVAGRSASEIAGYISAVARNGLVDCLREAGRMPRPVDNQDEDGEHHPDQDLDFAILEYGAAGGGLPGPVAPDLAVESREFAAALVRCAGELRPKWRRLWMFRVFLELPTRDIAAHPQIGLKPAHVDVLLQRARNAIRNCMQSRGFLTDAMPRGAFFEIWKAFEAGGLGAEGQ